MKKKQIIEKNGVQYEVIRVVKKASEKRVIVNDWDLTEYEKWYDKQFCLEAVKSDGDSLQYVDKRVFIKNHSKKQKPI